MNTENYDATLADWIICELPDGRRFLAGKVTGDRKERFRDGAYITTSLVISPADRIIDGNVVETFNSRYLLTERYAADDALFAKLDAWIAAHPKPVTLRDVLASGDGELFVAYILRGFRAATAQAVWSRDRGCSSHK